MKFLINIGQRKLSLYDCYDNPSYTTVTGFNSMRFTTMSTIEGLKALFIDNSVNCYVVADRNDLKQFADALHVGFCEYREEK